MKNSEEEARRKRAEQLRKKIEDVAEAPADSPVPRPDESPNEYVQRRMREIDRKPPKDPQ